MKIFKMTSVLRYWKLRAFMLLLFTIHCSLFTFTYAQSSFTQRLQQSKNGEGKITVTQDKAIDELVNGPVVTAPTRTKTTTTQQKPTETQQKTAEKPAEKKELEPKAVAVEHHDTTTIVAPEEIQKKIMKGVKVAGYRVQVFAGGNTRNDRMKAERIGSEIKSLFPGVPVYVHFYSPRWICRMGNYRTFNEANSYCKKVKAMGYKQACVVKGKITVQN